MQIDIGIQPSFDYFEVEKFEYQYKQLQKTCARR
jgi:hypothetical protein